MPTSPSLQLDQTRRELARLLPADLPVDLDRVFPKLDGWGMKRSNRKRAELLAKAAPVLKAALAPDERVQYVATGIVSHWWEQLMAGWVSVLINRTTLVLTTQRLLLIHTNSRGRPESYVNQIRLDGIRKVTRGWLGGALKLTLGRGSLTLTGMRRADARQISTMLGGRSTAAGAVTALCPACFEPAAGHPASCARCRTSVKSPRTAALRSLVLPGLGDFYLGHRVLASIEMAGSLASWAVIIALMLSAFDPNSEQSPAQAAVFGGVLLLIVNGFDALLTYAQAKKGLHSLDRHLPTAPAAGHLVADRPRLGMSAVTPHRP